MQFALTYGISFFGPRYLRNFDPVVHLHLKHGTRRVFSCSASRVFASGKTLYSVRVMRPSFLYRAHDSCEWKGSVVMASRKHHSSEEIVQLLHGIHELLGYGHY